MVRALKAIATGVFRDLARASGENENTGMGETLTVGLDHDEICCVQASQCAFCPGS